MSQSMEQTGRETAHEVAAMTKAALSNGILPTTGQTAAAIQKLEDMGVLLAASKEMSVEGQIVGSKKATTRLGRANLRMWNRRSCATPRRSSILPNAYSRKRARKTSYRNSFSTRRGLLRRLLVGSQRPKRTNE